MPNYIFKHPEKERYVEVFFRMNDEKKYQDEEGVEWERRWTVPHASVDSLFNSDPFDIQSHVDKTGKMKGTMGDLFAASKEMSERRAEKLGSEDPVKREMFDKYEKKNKTKHFFDRPSKIENSFATIDFTKPSPPDIDI